MCTVADAQYEQALHSPDVIGPAMYLALLLPSEQPHFCLRSVTRPSTKLWRPCHCKKRDQFYKCCYDAGIGWRHADCSPATPSATGMLT
jgi:hypothetical protein